MNAPAAPGSMQDVIFARRSVREFTGERPDRAVLRQLLAALNERGFKSELGIPEEQSAFAPIVVGMPASEGPPSPRRSPEIIGWR